MGKLTPITDATIAPGTKVLVRADLDVPMSGAKIKDLFRLIESERTLSHLQSQGAKIVVIGHLGKGNDTLRAVSLALNIGHTFIGEMMPGYIQTMRDGEIVLLENIRKDSREMLADPLLAEELARGFDIYVFDAFAVAHRKHTSIIHLPKILKTYGGIRFTEEIEEIDHARNIKERFYIFGGGKVSTKLPFLRKVLGEDSVVAAGGVMLNTILKAEGIEVGQSVVSDDTLGVAKGIFSHSSFVKPIDVIIEKPTGEKRATQFDDVGFDETIMDIGPQTVEKITQLIESSRGRAFVWNGPLGWYEKGYKESTETIGKKIIETSPIHTIIGGGDTHTVLYKIIPHDSKNFFVSTGGGALLSYLIHGTLPIFE